MGTDLRETVIDVLYEDAELLFVNKPPGLIVQRAHDAEEPVLFELAAARTEGPLFLLQRLDRGTSGVMFFSKSAAINARLTRQFELHQIEKQYVAICEGELAQSQTIDAPIARAGAIKFAVRDAGKRAATHVTPIAAAAAGSLLSVRLETGRTHQIRVHLAAIGHPLAGDWLYGSRNAPRPMLHAQAIRMLHPLTRQPLEIAVAPPRDFIEEGLNRRIALPWS